MVQSKYNRDALARMAAEGLTARQMAERLEISRSAVIGACHRMDVTISGHRDNWASNAPQRPRVMPDRVRPSPTYAFVSPRRAPVPPSRRCMWLHCEAASIDTGKPYCQHHAHRAGVVAVGEMCPR